MDLNHLMNSVETLFEKQSRPLSEEKKEGKLQQQQLFEFNMEKTTAFIVKELTHMGDILKENPSSYELETRLIMKPSNSHKFTTNIPLPLFDKILNFFTMTARHYKFTPWYYTSDHYFPNHIRRRETWSNSPSLSSSIPHTVEWVKKKPIEKSDWNVDMRPLSMRVSLALEKKIDPTPAMISNYEKKNFEKNRSKQTCAFKDKVLTIYFAHVWKGETEYETSVSIPTCNIEIEYNNKTICSTTTPEEIIYNLIARTLETQGLNSPLSLSKIKRF
jgi:hypothetical protein